MYSFLARQKQERSESFKERDHDSEDPLITGGAVYSLGIFIISFWERFSMRWFIRAMFCSRRAKYLL
jgi:hypothetical protein